MGKLTRRKRRNNHKNNGNTIEKQESNHIDNTKNQSWFTQNANLISRGLFQFMISWFVIGIIVNYMSSNNIIKTSTNVTDGNVNTTTKATVANESPLKHIQIVKEELESYHEIIKLPKVWKYVNAQDGNNTKKRLKRIKAYNVLDFTSNVNGTIMKQFGTTNEKPKLHEKLLLSLLNAPNKKQKYSISRYNEVRKGMYTTSLFQDDTYNIDGYNGERIVHMGMDIYAKPGTKVYSFMDGVIHSFGYNDAPGDYGYVVVVEYNVTVVYEGYTTLWALYGHLSKRSLDGKYVGQGVVKGGIIGSIGGVHENGGWSNPHVHFQLSRNKPNTHDMPGVVSMLDRERALIDYPDPRIVLGPLY